MKGQASNERVIHDNKRPEMQRVTLSHNFRSQICECFYGLQAGRGHNVHIQDYTDPRSEKKIDCLQKEADIVRSRGVQTRVILLTDIYLYVISQHYVTHDGNQNSGQTFLGTPEEETLP